ncbi:MAG: hypothetical protein LBL62_07715 [Planctomycetaceae bacterium]|nr:hypothetical protein [Planctomycetaceae bacterium]
MDTTPEEPLGNFIVREMKTTIIKGFIQEAIEIGEERGELKGYVNAILAILRKKFTQVLRNIVDSLNRRTSVIALESLVIHAATCSSLDDFAADLSPKEILYYKVN